MRFRSSLLAMFMSLLLALTVHAQPPQSLDRVAVWIWPEYDRPEVLVIYNVSLSAQTSLPAEVNFRIPKTVGRPNAVAMKDVDGSLVNLSYSSADEGDWSILTFTSPVPDFQIEYYDATLKKEGSQRNYSYTWPGFFAVNDLTVQVQQPLGASQMQIVPRIGSGATGADGLTYYNADVGKVAAGTKFTYTISYQKSSDALSVSSQPVSPAAPIDQNTPGRQTMQEVLPWVIAGLGVLLIFGGGFWFWQSGRERQNAPGRRRHAAEKAAETGAGQAIYCHQCGKRASPGDVFCRTCGTRLRV